MTKSSKLNDKFDHERRPIGRLFRSFLCAGIVLATVLSLANPVIAQTAPDPQKTIADLAGPDVAARTAACEAARGLSPADLSGIFALATTTDDAGIAARRALANIAARSSAPDVTADKLAAMSAAWIAGIEQAAKAPGHIRSELIDHLGAFASGAADVTAAEKWLDDPTVAESAMRLLSVLAQSGRLDAAQVLAKRLADPGSVDRSALLNAVAAVGRSPVIESAVKSLMQSARDNSDGATALSAEKILSRSTDRSVLMRAFVGHRSSPLQNSIDSAVATLGTFTHQVTLDRDFAVNMAHALAAQDEEKGGYAAVETFRALGDVAGLYAMTRSANVGVRRAAERAIVELTKTDGSNRAIAAAKSAEAEDRMTGIKTLVLTRHPAAANLLAYEIAHGDENLLDALILAKEIDDADFEVRIYPDLLRAMRSQSREISEAGATALLASVRNRLHRKGPLPTADLLTCLEVLGERDAIDAALEIAGVIATPDLLPALDRPAIAARGDAVARTKIAIARRMLPDQKDKAVAILFDAARKSASKRTRQKAVETLKSLGEDTRSLAARSGFIVTWKMLGGFPETTEATIADQPFGEDGPDTTKSFSVRGKDAMWVDVTPDGLDGEIDLRKISKPADNVTLYAVAEITRPEAGDYLLKIGSDDGVAAWVNRKLVHKNFAARAVRVDEDVVPIRLEAGVNRIMIKVTQGNGDFGMVVRLAAKDGVPVDLSKP